MGSQYPGCFSQEPLYSPSSPVNPQYYEVTYFTLPSSQNYEGSYLPASESIEETPTSLGWSRPSDYVKLYKFIVPGKGKRPFLEHLLQSTPTPTTPYIVYLDKTNDQKKFPCQYPGVCSAKPFSRSADLERHYKSVHSHSDTQDTYHCDYPKCNRHRDPFTRKDHYRDHLRDFHKEDIGCAKDEKIRKGKKGEKEQRIWLSERKISPEHWRCAKCLVMNMVSESEWTCQSCQIPCREEQRSRRESLLTSSTDDAELPQEDASTSQYYDGNFVEGFSSPPLSLRLRPTTSFICRICKDSYWVMDGVGRNVACVCQNPESAVGSNTEYGTYQSTPTRKTESIKCGIKRGYADVEVQVTVTTEGTKTELCALINRMRDEISALVHRMLDERDRR